MTFRYYYIETSFRVSFTVFWKIFCMLACMITSSFELPKNPERLSAVRCSRACDNDSETLFVICFLFSLESRSPFFSLAR